MTNENIQRMPSSGMLRRVALARTDVSEEHVASIRVTRIGELGTTLAVTSNRCTLRRNTKSETRGVISHTTAFFSHRSENLKSYIETYRLLVGKSEGERPLGRPSCWWVDNIKMNLGEIGWGDMDGIGLAQDRDKWRVLVECGNEPLGSIKCRATSTPGPYYRW
jgi:hypothetical protein